MVFSDRRNAGCWICTKVVLKGGLRYDASCFESWFLEIESIHSNFSKRSPFLTVDVRRLSSGERHARLAPFLHHFEILSSLPVCFSKPGNQSRGCCRE